MQLLQNVLHTLGFKSASCSQSLLYVICISIVRFIMYSMCAYVFVSINQFIQFIYKGLSITQV